MGSALLQRAMVASDAIEKKKDFAKILCGKGVGSENVLSPRT